MKIWLVLAALGAAAGATPVAAQSYVSDAEAFIKAVDERDGAKVTEAIRARPTIVNSRNLKGQTALVIAISRRDDQWTRFLLGNDANPDLATRDGETPLIAAARVGFADAAELLLSLGAEVDKSNRMGETPLIVAVQQRQPAIVKLLLAAGADPDKTDTAAGYSARDYANRDTRSRELIGLIEEKGRKSRPPAKDMNSFKLD